jgi:hypothetical protein
MVHDFTWAADKIIFTMWQGPNGVDIHFLYKTTHNLFRTGKFTTKNSTVNGDLQQVGDYPYKQYSVIQGGDGGMEYAMCTLI